MGDRTGIEWADATWNPIRARWTGAPQGVAPPVGWHCEHVSEGCRNCYAETLNRRLGTRLDFKPGNLAALDSFVDDKLLLAPLRWKRPRTIFVGSMTDLFGRWVTDAHLDRIFAVMALCPQHRFLLLTKRPERMRAYLTAFEDRGDAFGLALAGVVRAAGLPKEAGIAVIDDMLWPLPNVWLGTSVEDQAAADARIPHLLATPAAKRFLSSEPLLGPVVAWTHKIAQAAEDHGANVDDGQTAIDWVIAGGESGANARPMHPDWARSLRDQCAAAWVPFFFKQWGEWTPGENASATVNRRSVQTADWFDGRWLFEEVAGDFAGHADDEPDLYRAGKRAAGRLLDGVTHDGVPS